MTTTGFDYVRSNSLDEALATIGDGRLPYAGGTDLLPRLRSGIDRPERLVDIKPTGLGDSIEVDGRSVRLGALTTLATISNAADLGDTSMVLRRAAASAATTQIRNRATIAGNLVQRPRCPYFRHEELTCWLEGGDTCHARHGHNEHHAIFGTDRPCVAVHPSDPANALIALDAELSVRGPDGTREIAVEHLFRPPTQDNRIEHTLAGDELITGVDFVLPDRSSYVKVMDRALWAFALVAVAMVVRTGDDGSANGQRACVVAGGVANTPMGLPEVAEVVGNAGSIADLRSAAERELASAQPLDGNAYKRDLLLGALVTAYEELLDADG